MNKTSTPVKSVDKSNLIYISLITLVWLITYFICQIIFNQRLGWDEVAYMSVAKGIVQDFDFSARAYTIMGIIKHGYPTNLINFPVFPIYLAVFFKLFGISLNVAYFSSWIAALGTCIFIYFIFLLLSEKSHKMAFFVSLSYLFCPGIILNCDSAMMEQAGCFLLAGSTYLILRDYSKGVFGFFTALKFSLTLLILWLFKSLFIGYFFGLLVFILLAYNSKITGIKIKTNLPFYAFIPLVYGIFVVLFYLIKKFIFYPVAPMMTFSPIQEFTQVYADFLGGYFNNFSENLIRNIQYFFSMILAPYFIYPATFMPYTGELLSTTSHYVFLGVYFFILLVVVGLLFAIWNKLMPKVKVFVCFAITSIVSFNLIFNFLLMSYHSNIWRYNLYYFPLYIICVAILLKECSLYLKQFVSEHPCISKYLITLIFVFCYFPMFITMTVHYVHLYDWYHKTAKKNSEL